MFSLDNKFSAVFLSFSNNCQYSDELKLPTHFTKLSFRLHDTVEDLELEIRVQSSEDLFLRGAEVDNV